MKTKQNIKAMLILFCVLFFILCAYLVYILGVYGTRWIASPYNTHINKMKSMVVAGDIQDRNGEILAHTEDGERQYADKKALRRALCHVVGDSYGQTMSAEAVFSKYTLGFDRSIFENFRQYINGTAMNGSDVNLTVDSELSLLAYDLMDDYWGSIVVMNYKTGEILTSVSQPTFDPEKMEAYLSGEETPAGSAMVNRATMGRYTPGSTFKIVTLIAAIRYVNGVENMSFDCHGPLAFDEDNGKYLENVILPADYVRAEEGERDYDRKSEYAEDVGAEPVTIENYNVVRDYQNEYHGKTDLEKAFAQSCNTTFARLAMMVGPARMERTARELCLGEEFQFEDIPLYKSSYEAGGTDLSLAWSGIGQYKDLVTPMQMCMLAGAIANDGVMMEPKLLKDVVAPGGSITKAMQSRAYKRILSQREAELVQSYMRQVVEVGTGKRAAIDGYDICGKTGTAEISSDKSVNTHAWFVGFVMDEEHPLAISVILEQAGGGGSVASPVARKVLNKAIQLGY